MYASGDVFPDMVEFRVSSSPPTLLTITFHPITLPESLRMKHGEAQSLPTGCEVHAMTQYLIGLTIPLEVEAVAITGLDHDIRS